MAGGYGWSPASVCCNAQQNSKELQRLQRTPTNSEQSATQLGTPPKFPKSRRDSKVF